MYNYFPFVSTGNFEGSYSQYSSTSFNIPLGSICNPSDILKFNAGTNSWYQITESHLFLNNEVEISSVNSTDWNISLKTKWFDDFLSYINLINYLTPTEYNILFNLVNFQELSAPS